MKSYLPVFILCVLLSIGISASGQNGVDSFEIQPKTELTEQYQSALEAANLERFRLKDADRVLSFDNGFTVKLFSASKIEQSVPTVNVESYPSESSLEKSVRHIFSITDNGLLTVRSEIDSRSKLANIGKGFPNKTRTVITKSDFDKMSKSKRDIVLSRPHQYVIE